MHRLRNPQWVLILIFLAMVAGVPLIQMVIEVREKNGIQALDFFSQAPTAANLRAYERSLEAANWAARLTRPWIQFAHFAWLKDGGEKVVAGCKGWYFYKPGLSYMLAGKSANSMNDPVPAIVDFRDQLAAVGIRLVLMPVPNKESVYPDHLTSRAETRRVVLSPRTRDVLERLRAAHVEVIDLFKEFETARQQAGSAFPDELYLAHDTHWSPTGVDLAAKAAARRLLELGCVEPGRLEYAERSAPVRRVGDILRMLQVPLLERCVNPEVVSCVQVLQSNGEIYRDIANAEILVLGDSFMRIYQQDDPTGAGFIAHLAKELKQPLLGLVNDGGGSTLVRQELHGRPAFLKNKKVILWEFVERDIGLGIEGWKRVPLPSRSSSGSSKTG
jgi:hypothetical protein